MMRGRQLTATAVSHSPAARARSTLVQVVLILVVVTAAVTGVGLAGLYAFRGLMWAAGVVASYVGAIGWVIAVPLVALAIFETFSRQKTASDGMANSVTPGKTAEKPNTRRASAVLCAGTAAVILSGNLCLNIAAARIDAHYQQRQQQGVDIYKNHDLAKLVGQCVRLAILRHASGLAPGDERGALEAVAVIAPERWASMTDTRDGKQPDPRVLALADAKLTQFIQEPRAEALHHAEWSSMLTDWRAEAGADALTDATLDAAAHTIARDFGITLREALKADFEKGGKAWAAMQLDIAQQLLNHTPVSMATGNGEITDAMAEVKGLLADDAKGLPALHRTVLDARQAQDEYARAVTRNFDQVVGMLARIEADVVVVKAQTAAGLTNDAIFALVKRIEMDGSLSTDAKREKMEPLLAQIIENQPANVPKALVPADVQRAVERTYAGASKIVRFAALARVGLDNEADELAAEIDRTTAGLSDTDKYEFFVVRGDRYWSANDYWNAATWYAQAMALRVDDPAVVHRAATSACLAPGRDTFTREVQLAQSWVERCLAKAQSKSEASLIDLARLHATHAVTLGQLGKAGAAIEPARSALRLLAEVKDAPVGRTYRILVDSADALRTVCAIDEAESAIRRAMAAALKSSNSDSGAVVVVLSTRAGIRLNRGDLAGAERDITKSIAWRETQSPPNYRELALNYSWRADIRRARGDQAGAEADIARSIAWGEAQSPRDERNLSIWYASRAGIRRVLGDLAGAEQDIARSIAWGEAQSPRDERSLAIWYGTRAEIGRDRGDLRGAEADIARSIAWGEAQSPRDEGSLAFWYETEAIILAKATRLTEAKVAIDMSARLYTNVFGADHEWTKITLRRQQAIHAGKVPE